MKIISISLPEDLILKLDTISNGNRSHFIRNLLLQYDTFYEECNSSNVNIKQTIKEEFLKLLQEHDITPQDLTSIPTPETNNALYNLAQQMMK